MNIEDQVTLLMQGTEYGDEELKMTMAGELHQRLIQAGKEQRPLQVYCGFDPTTSNLHLGHTVPMRKLRQFQELGHDVTFVVGSFTSLIGDPSGHDKLRPQLTMQQVEENARTYADQAYRVLDRARTKIRFNSDWLSKLEFQEVIRLASNFSIQQFLTRDAFRKRWENGEPVYLHETFYSIIQGYDAHTLHADVQVGGTDQLFNIVTASRKVMSFLGDQPNIALILSILPGTDGEVKMSKSLGNDIPLLSTPEDMYGKVMSIPDKAMAQYMRLVTGWSIDKITETEVGLRTGALHPRDVKMTLAHEIVSTYHDPQSAVLAEEAFKKVFQHKDVPDDMPAITLQPGQSVLDILVSAKLVSTKSDGRRMVEQKAVKLDGELLVKFDAEFPHPGVLQVGKRRFVRVI